MASKNAQFGLDTVLSYFVFAMFLVFTILALTLSGCGSGKSKVERGIAVDKGVVAELRASEQLSAYLATEMPEKAVLYGRIDEAKENVRTGTSFNSLGAKSFLDEHPEVYVDRDYGGFISAVYAYRDDGRLSDVFDAVTKALFYRPLYSRGVRDFKEENPDEPLYLPAVGEFYYPQTVDGLYYSPIISVLYETPVVIGDEYGAQNEFYLKGENLVSAGAHASRAGAYASRLLPTGDLKGLTVKLKVNMEEESEPLP